MPHARDKIRDAVAVAVTGLTTTRNRVFTSRIHPVNDNELPCLLVFTRSESSSPQTLKPPRLIERNLSVMIEGYVKIIEGYDQKLDKIAVEVEQAIYNSTSLAAQLRDIFLTETEIKITGDAEKPVAVVSMTFNARYHTAENDPEILT
jgi:hypothetical protein